MAKQQNIAPPAAFDPDSPRWGERIEGGKDWRRLMYDYQSSHHMLTIIDESWPPTSNVVPLWWRVKSSADAAEKRTVWQGHLRKHVSELVSISAPTAGALATKIKLAMWAEGLGDPEGWAKTAAADSAQRLLATIYADALALQKSADKAAKRKKSRKG